MAPSFLTSEGYEKLQEELEYLRTEKRQEVANRLHEAMEGGELIEDALAVQVEIGLAFRTDDIVFCR